MDFKSFRRLRGPPRACHIAGCCQDGVFLRTTTCARACVLAYTHMSSTHTHCICTELLQISPESLRALRVGVLRIAASPWPARARRRCRPKPRPAACGGPGLSPLGRRFGPSLRPALAGPGLTAIISPPSMWVSNTLKRKLKTYSQVHLRNGM